MTGHAELHPGGFQAHQKTRRKQFWIADFNRIQKTGRQFPEKAIQAIDPQVRIAGRVTALRRKLKHQRAGFAAKAGGAGRDKLINGVAQIQKNAGCR